jgi:hypothetical protein
MPDLGSEKKKNSKNSHISKLGFQCVTENIKG